MRGGEREKKSECACLRETKNKKIKKMQAPRSAVQQKHQQIRKDFKICLQIKTNLQQNNM